MEHAEAYLMEGSTIVDGAVLLSSMKGFYWFGFEDYCPLSGIYFKTATEAIIFAERQKYEVKVAQNNCVHYLNEERTVKMHKKERRKLKYQQRSREMVRLALAKSRKHKAAVAAWHQRYSLS